VKPRATTAIRQRQLRSSLRSYSDAPRRFQIGLHSRGSPSPVRLFVRAVPLGERAPVTPPAGSERRVGLPGLRCADGHRPERSRNPARSQSGSIGSSHEVNQADRLVRPVPPLTSAGHPLEPPLRPDRLDRVSPSHDVDVLRDVLGRRRINSDCRAPDDLDSCPRLLREEGSEPGYSSLSMLGSRPEPMSNQNLILLRSPNCFLGREMLPQKLAKQLVGEDPPIGRTTNDLRLQILEEGQYLNWLGSDGLGHSVR